MKIEKKTVTIENALRDYEKYAVKTVEWDMDEAATFLRALAEIPKNGYKLANQNGVIRFAICFGVDSNVYTPVIWLEKTNYEAIYNSLQNFKMAYELNEKHNFSYASETSLDLYAKVIATLLVRILEVFGNAIYMDFMNDYSLDDINEKLKSIEKKCYK